MKPAAKEIGRPTKVVLIIVHYGNLLPTERLCADVQGLRHRGQSAVVAVVANDLSERPAGLSAEVRWLIPPRNMGYAGAAEIASRELEADAYVVMNSDVLLEQDAYSACLDRIAESDAVGVVGPVLRFPGGAYQSGPGRLSPLAKRPAMGAEPGFEDVPCDWISGAAMFLSGRMVREIGFDSSYFLGAEDVDLCVRARRAGYGVVCVGGENIKHDRSRVIGEMWRYYGPRNRLWFVRRCFGFPWSALAVMDVLTRTVRSVAADILYGRGLRLVHMGVFGFLHGVGRQPTSAAGPRPDEPVPIRRGWVGRA